MKKNIEKKLAEVQVLSDEILQRRTSVDQGKTKQLEGTGYITKLPEDYRHLEESVDRARLLVEKYREARKLIKKNKGKKHTSENELNSIRVPYTEAFLEANCLADSLNKMLQSLYAEQPLGDKVNLSKLEQNTTEAPLTEDGETLYQVHSTGHDFSRDSKSKLARHDKSHGLRNLEIYHSQISKYGLAVDFRNQSGLPEDGLEFLETQTDNYLDMAKTILKTIAEKETDKLAPQDSTRKKSPILQRMENWKRWHEKPVKIALAGALVSAGIVGGVAGTLGYQEVKRQELRDQLSNIEKSVLMEGNQIRENMNEINETLLGAYQRQNEYLQEQNRNYSQEKRNSLIKYLD